MPVKKYKPTSPGRRFVTTADFSEITAKRPQKNLLARVKRQGGRNGQGRITVRHQGGGHKKRYRIIDFKRAKVGVPGVVASIEYDPNRSARIALIKYVDGDKRYIVAPVGLTVGQQILSGPGADIKPGNSLELAQIPVGTLIHNIELYPGRGAQMVRSAGAVAQLMAKEGTHANVRLPSGEMRLVPLECRATIGQVGNLEHENISIGKAGRNRWKGKRPTVRGVVMNPVDHPHGGGEGRSPIGRNPVTPWGKPTLGHRTRKKKPSDRMIIKRRGAK